MVVKRGFTLIEMIMVIIVASILSLGTFKALEAMFVRSAKARAVTEMSLNSQVVLDQLSQLLYHRIPGSVVGYTPSSGVCEPIDDLNGSHPMLEWIGTADESFLAGDYDGFVDMNASSPPVLSVPGMTNAVETTTNNKFGGSPTLNLVFAGTFDTGGGAVRACNGAFGLHHAGSALSHDITIAANQITITDALPTYIYEKFYLADTAYAVARKGDVDASATCITGLDVEDDALLLFYDYRPYSGETFCADFSGSPAGKVAVLAEEVQGFRAEYLNETIRLSLDMNRTIRQGITPVHITKQKVVF